MLTAVHFHSAESSVFNQLEVDLTISDLFSLRIWRRKLHI